ncbi:hypothetical protein T08_9200 [Trichinella sp. T8]|nr:hypothetical protein T08_9200 [Trichinella sp. T8]
MGGRFWNHLFMQHFESVLNSALRLHFWDVLDIVKKHFHLSLRNQIIYHSPEVWQCVTSEFRCVRIMFYSTNSTTTTTLKHTVDYTALLHRVFFTALFTEFSSPLYSALLLPHIYTRFSCTMTYFHCYLNITSIPEIESFHYTLWQYRLPIIFSREQIIGQLRSIFSFRRNVCQESIAKHSCKQVIYSILNCY